jgi:uncharacterized protein (TIGR00251 family)
MDVRVSPGSKHDDISWSEADGLRIRVNAPPAEGKANKAAIRLLAEFVDIAPSRISVLRGAASRSKVLSIEGIANEELHDRLRCASEGRR